MPIVAATRKNFYKDSVVLMRVAQSVAARDGITRVSLLMGTPANKDILVQAGLLAPEIAEAAPADLMILVEGEQAALAPSLAEIEEQLAGRGNGGRRRAQRSRRARSRWASSGSRAPRSRRFPFRGPTPPPKRSRRSRRGLHVFLFSDNVPLAEEQAVKRLAAKKGLLVMGPDCGTAIIGGVPLGFANAVRRGSIGLVGASGTGMQEVSVRIHELGEGVSHALGTGSRDVCEEVGGTTLLAGLDLLARDRGHARDRDRLQAACAVCRGACARARRAPAASRWWCCSSVRSLQAAATSIPSRRSKKPRRPRSRWRAARRPAPARSPRRSRLRKASCAASTRVARTAPRPSWC